MKRLADPDVRTIWRTLQVCLLLCVGAAAASYRAEGAAASAAALVWLAALAGALRYAWFGLRRRRAATMVLAAAVLVLVASGVRTGGAILAGVLASAILLRGLRTHRRLSDRQRAALFLVVWVPLVALLALAPARPEGAAGRFIAMARWTLIAFVVGTPLDLVAHMRLHFLRLRPKLAICAGLIGAVPLAILTVFGLLLLWATLGGSRANRAADVMEVWRADLAAGRPVLGEPFAWTPGAPADSALAWVPGYAHALDRHLGEAAARADTTGYVEADGGLWLVRRRPDEIGGVRIDARALDRLAQALRADVAIRGLAKTDSAGRGGLTVSLGDDEEPNEIGGAYLAGRWHDAPPDSGFWSRPRHFGGSLLAVATVDGARMERGQVLLAVKTSVVDLRDEFVGSQNRFNTVMVVALGVVAVTLLAIEGVALLFGLRIAAGITGAVRELHLGTRRLAAGDLDTHIAVPNEDEFGDLAASFNEMTAAVKQGREHALARQRLQQEMETARQIQARLLPASEPLVAGWELTGRSLPSRQVGGDYFDFLALADGRLGVAIGDVSGKGVPAALLMANLQASLQGQVIHPASVAELMARINDLMVQSTDAHMFASFFYGVLDPATGRFTCANAGHNPPLLVRTDGRVEWLRAGGLLLGMMPGMTYEQAEVDLARGDVLVLYTDGITEAEAPHGTPAGGPVEGGAPAAHDGDQDGEEPDESSGEMFGEESLERVVRDVADQPAAAIREAILAAVAAHLAGDPAGDDITLVVVKRALGERIVSGSPLQLT